MRFRVPFPPHKVSASSMSYRPIIDLQSPSPWLGDDLRCLKGLSRPDQGHPHCRLAFLWFICYQWCAKNHDLALIVWLGIIEGDEGGDNLWLWENGDETRFRAATPLPQENIQTYPEHVLRYPILLRKAVSALTSGDWEHAQLALERRCMRPGISRCSESHEIAPFWNVAPRICAFMWLLLHSKWMKYADIQRGLCRLLYDDIGTGILDQWKEVYFLTSATVGTSLPLLRFQDSHCSSCSRWQEEQGQWVVMLSTIYPLPEIYAVCQNMLPCNEGNAIRYGCYVS